MSGFAQYLVAGLMAVGVVDRFEPVHVTHQHGHRTVLSRVATEFGMQPVENAGTVRDGGESVMRGLDARYL